MKTSNLTGAALDWAVAKAMGLPVQLDPMGFGTTENGGYWIWYDFPSVKKSLIIGRDYSPSTDWAQGGPIIERERIGLTPFQSEWVANPSYMPIQKNVSGPTPLIAAMRCYVASKLGDEIEIPEELK